MHEERFKRQEFEARLAEAQRQLDAMMANQEPEYQPTLDEDPVAFLSMQMAQMERQRFYDRRELSKELALKDYGAETVTEAQRWAEARCAQDPAFNDRMLRSAHPFKEAIAEFQRDKVVQTVTPSDLQEFMAWKAAQAGMSQAPRAAPVASPAVSQQPKSLVSAPSAGGHQAIATGPGAAFNSVFK
jgi:hypothetical protein